MLCVDLEVIVKNILVLVYFPFVTIFIAFLSKHVYAK